MFKVKTRDGNEQTAKAIEQRLHQLMPSKANREEVFAEYDADETLWAMAQLTEEQFEKVQSIEWQD